MLTGPQNMPVFGNNQLSPDDKAAIIAYIQDLNKNEAADPGGWAIGRYGPVPEGLVIFLIGIAALVFATLWIAGKS
jgi:ubiquinol-cytochrome c reductase cytochrome c subunit